MRAVLAQHGWARTKGGENEYWRRPGKNSGTSATLKGGVFFVFSTNAVAERFGYTVRYLPVGQEDAALGAPTQMAVFSGGNR